MEQAERPSETQFIRLLAGQAPEGDGPDPAGSATLLALLLANWQVLPGLDPTLLETALVAEDHPRFARARLAVTAFEQAQIVGCAGFLAALDTAGIRYALLKGAAAGCLLYPERHLRAAWDFDLGVGWDDLADAEALALDCGFHQAQRDPDRGQFVRADRELRAIVEESHFELGFLARRLLVTNLPDETRAAIRDEPWTHQFWHDADTDAPWCYAVVDIHHKLSLDIELDGLLACSWQKLYPDHVIGLPDFAWFGAHLVFKLYWESVHAYGKGLYQYADLVRLVPMLDPITFLRLVSILREHNLTAAAYHVFKHLPRFGIALPDHVAAFIAEARVPRAGTDPIDTNDLGDMWPKLWNRR
ncbi:nucleotidyltransferase family protein [Sphingomonas sp. R86521]|uniref:nucleotidyltransferase family protein n=1 Tax=Sphingomonas sp. R86521 TaxID=3093860 RepID=UPI0036D41F9B